MAPNELAEWYWNVPRLSRYWFTGSVVLPLLGRIGLLSPYSMILVWEKLAYSFHIWRPITALLYYPISPQTGFHYLINLYFLYSYSTPPLWSLATRWRLRLRSAALATGDAKMARGAGAGDDERRGGWFQNRFPRAGHRFGSGLRRIWLADERCLELAAQASGGSCCERCAEVEQMLEEAREELEEFQTSSRELEAELETQLQASERREQEARSALERSHKRIATVSGAIGTADLPA
uniref:Derlin n=1 Tax=Macrostomum lignano TaxID=282301 RepID=A0A1I8JNL3_9PLAT